MLRVGTALTFRALGTLYDKLKRNYHALHRPIYVYKGYQGHDYEHKYRVFKLGQKQGVKDTIKKELKLRSVVGI